MLNHLNNYITFFRTEEEINLDNFKEIEVPEDYREKFEKMDKEFLNE